ncbi:hypothetical protein B7463_g4677, partial [Scytalidium lignicola]
MAGRQAHGRPLSAKPKARKSSKKRSLDAYSIAAAENPDKVKIRKHRLGESEGEPSRPGKRARDEDNFEEDETELSKKQRRGNDKHSFNELGVEEGSDSEGNEWKLGQVDSDDDSELDSDEAFGESDEEKFQGFAFPGSSDKTKTKKKSKTHRGLNLEEDDGNDESDSELEDGDLGEDAIDLAMMLDATENNSDGEDAIHHKKSDRNQSGSESGDEDEDEDEGGSSDSESEISSADDEDETDPTKLRDLQNMILNLPQTDSSNKATERQRSDAANEHATPSEFGLTAKTKLTLEDLGLPMIKDPHIKKSLKLLGSDAKGSGVKGKLEVPLAKRQQDRLDRSAAYDKSKETLNRWTDTVKHNRRADHLIFPLPDQDTLSAQANGRLQPTITSKPFNELEATIQNILEESGLAPADGKDGEQKIREFEELETNKLSLEEVKARRAQLRMARELLFREEAKAKRIKKIKSKSYRKVHRKQREKEERLNREALAEAGIEPSEDELEAHDRRRAEERMGAKHRESKWAKSVKVTGRAAWDEDARVGITEMARRDEELRKRVEGRIVRTDGTANSDMSESDSEDDESGEDEAEEQQRLLRQLDDVRRTDAINETVPGGKLANLKFMRKAAEARKKENDVLADEIRREINGEDNSNEEDETADIGRRIFGPGSNQAGSTKSTSQLNEFEEPFRSDVDEEEPEARSVNNTTEAKVSTARTEKNSGKGLKSIITHVKTNEVTTGGAWSKVTETNGSINAAEVKRRRHKENNAVVAEEIDLSKAITIAMPSKPKTGTKVTSTLEVGPDSDGDSDNDDVGLPFAIRDQELIKRAFAGADVVGEFDVEKRQTIEDEDEKVIDNTLPGWGSWVGNGVSKKDKKRNKGRVLTKIEGIKEQNRKDAKLERVIINEKRVKKNSKYLASSLPHPFETRQQYERSLRLPVGPEWTTKETFQDATKPRILLKQGVVFVAALPFRLVEDVSDRSGVAVPVLQRSPAVPAATLKARLIQSSWNTTHAAFIPPTTGTGVTTATTKKDETTSWPSRESTSSVQVTTTVTTKGSAKSATTAKESPTEGLDDIITTTTTTTKTITVSAAPATVTITAPTPLTVAASKTIPQTVTETSSVDIFFTSFVTTTVVPSVSVITSSVVSGTVQILPKCTQSIPTGSYITTVTATQTIGPLITTIITPPSTIISTRTTRHTSSGSSTTTRVKSTMASSNIFQPVATDAPPSAISTRSDHPVPRLGVQPQNSPIGTNKFYANFFLGSQTSASWTHPYSVAWAKGSGASASWGLAVSHIDADQRVYGPQNSAGAVSYFINPVGIQSLVLSAAELGSSTVLTSDRVAAFSTNVNLAPSSGAPSTITFPLVQGMAFLTGIYNGSTPLLQTGVFFRSITKSSSSPKPGVAKYSIILEDGKTWLMYAYSPGGASLDFTVVNNTLAQATSNFQGIIQIAKNPGGNAEALYDAACGSYPTSVNLSGSVNGDVGSYTFSFNKAGMSNSTLTMFALPHHLESFDSTTKAAVTGVTLNTTTKGTATAVVADQWTLTETLPTGMSFAPWSPDLGSRGSLSQSAINAMVSIAASEVSQNMSQQTNLNSMYFSGKALAKFAGIVYVLHDMMKNTALANAGLENLKASFAVFANNTQQYPLVHETAWGGIVSSATYATGDSGADFGNTYYNDHHFHYGYFIYTAAVIAHLDPTWIPANRAYVNTLVRDIANPSTLDNYFPVSRSFDWYHGHSWAHGLFETADGKDQESSSEDSMSAYAIKMWGNAIGDNNMEARGNLQLAITARSLQHYYLYETNNTVEPANFIGNKVAGILFENKIDHTTYFGTNIEYIQGIHMLPLLPHSTLTRTKEFVTEEWNTYFSNGRADSIAGGWRGILYGNLGTIDPTTAWNFFVSANFDPSWLDGGASRTWYLAFVAALGGAPS